MARILLLVAAFAFVATGAMANIPDPDLSVIPPTMIITPDGSYQVDLVINGAQGVVAGAYVELEVSEEATGLVAWTIPVPAGATVPVCDGPSRIYAATANGSGVASFKIAGGGCVAQKNPQDEVEPFIIFVRADNFQMAEMTITSPDIVNSAAELPEDLGAPICEYNVSLAADVCKVGLSDAQYMTPPAKGEAGPHDCLDYVAPFDGEMKLGDIGVFTPYAKAGTYGTCDPVLIWDDPAITCP